MSRSRRRHLLVELARLPWWVSVLCSAVIFGVLRWWVPALAARSAQLAYLGQLVSSNAHWFAAIFLLPLPFALFEGWRRGRLVDLQSDVESLVALPWQDFEALVGEAYRRKGYRVSNRGGASSDGGIDLELRAKDKTLMVQCKRWKTKSVGIQPVRELYGVMTGEGAHGAIFVTSGRYTPDAIDFARDKPIKLIDGPQLVELLRGVQPSSGLPVNRSAETPEHRIVTTAEGPMQCPRCGSAMVRRVAKQGAGAGKVFWGCARFPDCRGTRN